MTKQENVRKERGNIRGNLTFPHFVLFLSSDQVADLELIIFCIVLQYYRTLFSLELSKGACKRTNYVHYTCCVRHSDGLCRSSGSI